MERSPPSVEVAYDAVLLSGGSARRLGGADKALLEIGGRTCLERALDALSGAGRVVAVGPRRPLPERQRAVPPVVWVRESPPGGGPALALTTAVPLLSAHVVAVLAVDVPLVRRADVERLVAAVRDVDGAVMVDRDGRRQVLVAAYRRTALPAAGEGTSMRALTAGLRLTEVVDGDGVCADCDTWDDVERLRMRA